MFINPEYQNTSRFMMLEPILSKKESIVNTMRGSSTSLRFKIGDRILCQLPIGKIIGLDYPIIVEDIRGKNLIINANVNLFVMPMQQCILYDDYLFNNLKVLSVVSAEEHGCIMLENKLWLHNMFLEVRDSAVALSNLQQHNKGGNSDFEIQERHLSIIKDIGSTFYKRNNPFGVEILSIANWIEIHLLLDNPVFYSCLNFSKTNGV